jgi:hypothetical protein
MNDTRDELLIATATAALIEGVAVALFLATAYVWLAIYATW